jgi:hypothetical protein
VSDGFGSRRFLVPIWLPPRFGDLGLVDPLLAQRLGGDAQIAGYLRYGVLLVGEVNQPDGFVLNSGE